MPLARSAQAFHGFARIGARAFRGRYGQVPAPLREPEAGRVQRGDSGLAFLRWDGGAGPPLVTLHGLNQNGWIWWRLASALPERTLVAPTLPGHGDSAPPTRGFALDQTADAVLACLDDLGLDRVHLAGHSWGGKVATVLAARAPGRVQSLVLADPVLPQGLGPVLEAAPALLDLAFAPERGPFPDREAWLQAARQVSHLAVTGALDEADHRVWSANFREEPDGRYAHRLDEAGFRAIVDGALQEDVTDRLDRVTCPVLLLRPTFSVAFWPGALRAIRRLADLAEHTVWGDHTFVHTNPLDTAERVEAFLSRAARSGTSSPTAPGP